MIQLVSPWDRPRRSCPRLRSNDVPLEGIGDALQPVGGEPNSAGCATGCSSAAPAGTANHSTTAITQANLLSSLVSFRKAYTSRTFRISSGEFAERVKNNPTAGAVHLAWIVADQGGLPVKVGSEVIGGVGVSGSPGGDKDEVVRKPEWTSSPIS
jgi:Haem-degrading